jgi:hypothetical protein
VSVAWTWITENGVVIAGPSAVFSPGLAFGGGAGGTVRSVSVTGGSVSYRTSSTTATTVTITATIVRRIRARTSR